MRTPRITFREGTADSYIYNEVVSGNAYGLTGSEKTVIDIGANVGIFSIFSALNGARVCAFEPEDKSCKRLIENIERAGVEDRVTVHRYAIGDIGKRKLYLDEENSGGHTFYGKGDYQIVETISLKRAIELSTFDRCDFLKVDCEGAEYEIFDNEKLFEKISKISMELHAGDMGGLIKTMSKNYEVAVTKSYPDPNIILKGNKWQ